MAIDTVTEACSVALLDGQDILQEIEIAPKGHSTRVLQMVEDILSRSQYRLGDMDVLAVDTGPGSFTGVRIGLGVAQGLAYGANLPVIGVNSMETLAASLDSGQVFPAIDARMKQVYCGLYQSRGSSRPVERVQPVVANPGELPFEIEGAFYGIGNGWRIHGEAMGSSLDPCDATILEQSYPEAKSVARIAAFAGLESAMDPMFLEATYVRNRVVNEPSVRN
ncbi:MAG: tRNA (adenosine(37)-N6)-threonylcarbamoyltransferase complex dimerization subunit type 1 TsaB [Gammaproteobacteria bacterium]|nr:tRNA (adenosine(37)-N6)-threonylcarbamoyltransferase complex dimerization subunit type 1 TsaB [Gammaproteobacteria bacterium]